MARVFASKAKNVVVSKKCAELALWCIGALREQHIKIMLEGEDFKVDWVTKRADQAEHLLRRAIKKSSK